MGRQMGNKHSSKTSRFILWCHDGGISVRRYAGEHHLLEFIIQFHIELKNGDTFSGRIECHGRLQRIMNSMNTNRCINELLEPKVVPIFSRHSSDTIKRIVAPHVFQGPHVFQDFLKAEHISFFLMTCVVSPGMSPMEYVSDSTLSASPSWLYSTDALRAHIISVLRLHRVPILETYCFFEPFEKCLFLSVRNKYLILALTSLKETACIIIIYSLCIILHACFFYSTHIKQILFSRKRKKLKSNNYN